MSIVDRHQPAFPDGPPLNVCLRAEPFPDWERAAGLVREAAPMDVCGPLYCIAASDLPADFNHNVASSWVGDSAQWLAYTGQDRWKVIGRHIAAAGRWYGPGVCIVFHDRRLASDASGDRATQFQRGLAVLVHELGHAIADDAAKTILQDQPLRDARIACVRSDPLFAAYATRSPQGDCIHGAPFIRAAIHLHHRTDAIHSIDLADCRIAPKAELYRLALASELNARRDSPIATILQDTPPRPFLQHWNDVVNGAREEETPWENSFRRGCMTIASGPSGGGGGVRGPRLAKFLVV